jgi:energy-converting hydrogenase Eha subunit G
MQQFRLSPWILWIFGLITFFVSREEFSGTLEILLF